jgi:hypothetical protein
MKSELLFFAIAGSQKVWLWLGVHNLSFSSLRSILLVSAFFDRL